MVDAADQPVRAPIERLSAYDAGVDSRRLVVVVRGVGDVGSAVAHLLFGAGYGVVMVDGPQPTTTRRGMAFADAVFDGQAILDGVRAMRAANLRHVRQALGERDAIPVYVRAWSALIESLEPAVLVDARMQKHVEPEVQRGLARLTIGLGPSVVAGHHADVVVETSWEGLGQVIHHGAARELAGEPRDLGGHARERYVYAPCDGRFRTEASLGDRVRKGQEIAAIGAMRLAAPLDGVLRGLVRDGVPVAVRTKLIEVDPRGDPAAVVGLGERPRRIAHGVLLAINAWRMGVQSILGPA